MTVAAVILCEIIEQHENGVMTTVRGSLMGVSV